MTEQHDQATPVKCTHCDKPMTTPVVCDYCHTIGPEAAVADHFALLDLPRRFDLDAAEIHRKFLALSRHAHPDFHAGDTPEVQQLHLQVSAALNQAYRTLKDPAARASYLLALFGGKSSADDKSVPDGFLGAMMAVLHETGHAMYERQLPVDWRSQPVGGARGMATHESQSLLIEMQASRSAEFVGWFAPVVRDAFSGTGPAWETGNVLRHYRRVERGLIRVDADEVSYPLHVILRFDLERALFAGELEIADLPGAWNDAMERYVGVRPDDDRDGCMQDIHWEAGAFGYFPTYTMGAMPRPRYTPQPAKPTVI